MDTQIEIAFNLNFITTEIKQDVDKKIESISAKLAGLINNIKKKVNSKK